jgi:single-strand DNA-binding protein
MAFSKVMIIGNLGRDPEMRYTPNGRGRDAQTGEWADLGTDWFRVTVWGDRAERTAEEFKKGNRVFVEGRFRTREYDAKDGTKRTSLEITADNVIALERRGRDEEGSFGAPGGGGSSSGGGGAPGGGGSEGGPVRPTRAPADDTDLDDLPF